MLLLVISIVSLVLVLNALRPLRAPVVSIPAFFAAWLVTETAPPLLLGALVVFPVLALLSGGSTATWAGLALAALVVAGLLRMIAVSERAEALSDAVVQQWEAVGPGSVHTPSLWRRYFVPMMFQHAEVERVVDVSYSDEHPRHKLDVFRRADHPTGCPTLLQVHGGGWVIGDKSQQGRPLMLQLARLGWVCFAPNYRLSPKATFPDHLVDVKRAIAWVREHGHQYGADPGFMVLTGGSAGGHLVALAALTQNDPAYQPGFEDADTSVQGCVPYYGIYDLHGENPTRAWKLRHDRVMTRIVMKTRDPEAFVKASPLAQVAADAPPFLVIHGRNDTLVPVSEARAFVEKLRAVSGQPVLYLELPGTEHAFDVFPSIRSDHVVRAVSRFLEALRVSAPARGQ